MLYMKISKTIDNMSIKEYNIHGKKPMYLTTIQIAKKLFYENAKRVYQKNDI